MSLDVYSFNIPTCRTVYPIKLIRSIKFPPDGSPHLQAVTEDLSENYTITKFIGDNPKRSFVRNALSHSSLFACEYCFGHAVRFRDCHTADTIKRKKCYLLQKEDIQQKIQTIQNTPGTVESKKLDDEKIDLLLSIEKDLDDVEKKAQSPKTQLVWPANTINKEPRTKEQLLDIINRIENGNEELTNYDVKGVKGRSLLIDLPGFDIVNDIPTEYLHSVSIGLVKRLLELTFNMGSNRQRTCLLYTSPSPRD